ncbi:MAG TPA: serine/threonine-protein phosphatase [Gammaproteobacteria bacterium]|nr:serine/threonine-protein phosphatase [Gammaproteobacteria bacterium]
MTVSDSLQGAQNENGHPIYGNEEPLLSLITHRHDVQFRVMSISHGDATTANLQSTSGFLAVQASHVGQLRAHNEDSSAWLPELGLAVVADGVGGYRAGEVASAIATYQIVSELYRRWLTAGRSWKATALCSTLEAALGSANHAIIEVAGREIRYQGMATTAVAAVFGSETLWLAHIGDSRLYRWRESTLTVLTHDHTLQQQLIDQGLCSPTEAAAAVGSNIITRALGAEASARVETSRHRLHAGDRYLLCTDGLHDMLEDREIASSMATIKNVQTSACHLLDLANLAGGHDNITVILVASTKQ